MESSDDTMMSLVGQCHTPPSTTEGIEVGSRLSPTQVVTSGEGAANTDSNSPVVQSTSDSIVETASGDQHLKIKITNWMSVSTWHWTADDENCGICRMAFDACCPECKLPGDDCPLVWGRCSHCYHMHCIIRWLNSQHHHQNCPLCRQEWKFKE